MSKPIRKVVTFRASSIGDCLMGKYLLDNVHAQHPDARCAIVVASRAAMIRDLLAAYPWIEVVEVNRKSLRGLWWLWRGWRGSDLVVTQYAGKSGGRFSIASKLMARLLARRGGLVGFSDASSLNGLLYDRLVTFDPQAAPAQMERGALSVAGLEVILAYPQLHSVSMSIERFGVRPQGYVLAHLFSGSNKRALSPERRREFVAFVASSLSADTEVVLTCTPAEQGEVNKAVAGTRAKVVADAALQEILGLIVGAKFVVAVDTGVAHCAAQMQVPLVVLTSCLGSQWWGPKQYGEQPHTRVLTNKAACGEQHRMVDYPPCLNAIPYDNTLLYL